jgi:hypothetical protein
MAGSDKSSPSPERDADSETRARVREELQYSVNRVTQLAVTTCMYQRRTLQVDSYLTTRSV